MKKTLITIFAAFALFASTAFAGIGTYGYIDLFYDNGPSGDSTGVYEFEYGMEFSEEGSPFSAVMELSFTGSEDVSFETATVTYASSDELSFSLDCLDDDDIFEFWSKNLLLIKVSNFEHDLSYFLF